MPKIINIESILKDYKYTLQEIHKVTGNEELTVYETTNVLNQLYKNRLEKEKILKDKAKKKRQNKKDIT